VGDYFVRMMTVRIMVYCNAGICGKIFCLRGIHTSYMHNENYILYCPVGEKCYCIVLYCILRMPTVDCGGLFKYFPQLQKQEGWI